MWRDLLNAAVTASSKTQVAADLGISRTAVSLIVHDKYPADTRHIASRVLEVYGRIPCPHLEKEISQAECKSYHSSQPPTSSPRTMKHWCACQTCKHNETKGHNSRSNS